MNDINLGPEADEGAEESGAENGGSMGKRMDIEGKQGDSRNAELPVDTGKDGHHYPSVVFDNFEQVLKLVGAFGRYQLWFILTMQVSVVLLCSNFVFMPYATYEPEVTCVVHGASHNTSVKLDLRNSTTFCGLYESGMCDTLTFDAPFHTIIEEWRLICGLDYVPQMINTIQMSGTVIAVLVTGLLSDTFGRRSVFYGSLFLLESFTFAGTLAGGWRLFAVCRFMVGALLAAVGTLLFVWAMEMTDQRHNVLMNLAGLWHFAYMITAVGAYLTAGWRPYLWCVNLIGLPLIFIYPLFVESPRWLIQQGQVEQAAHRLTTIGSHNRLHRVTISADSLRGIAASESARSSRNTRTDDTESDPKRRRSQLRLIFSSRSLLWNMALLALIVAATSAAVTAYIFQVSQQKGDPFVKFFLYGLFRLTTPLFIYFADSRLKWFGRRHMIVLPFAFVAVCFAVVVAIKTVDPATDSRSRLLVTAFLMAGAVASNCLWTGVGQYQIELFPTTVRNTTTALINLVDPIAGMMMPALIYLERFWPSLPFAFAEVLLLLALAAAWGWLPETKGREIPETIEQADRLHEEDVKRRRASGFRWTPLCAEETQLLDEDADKLEEEDDF